MKDRFEQIKNLPVSLLLADRPCLVVGGGKIAYRKIGHLLDANACVTVICPTTSPEVAALVDAGLITQIARPFEVGDVDGFVLAFSATSDRLVNRQVLEACRSKNILCSCVDGNWSKSDFTTPAIARQGNLTLTVSTGGQSCRQAKLVKNSLARHLEMIQTAELIAIGTDHRHLSIDLREPFHLTGQRLERAGFMIMQLLGVHEFMIINTCNRVELIAVVSHETATNGILRHILGFDKLTEDQFYFKRGVDAYEHLSLVTSGMLSQTPGETHIAAQLKDALAEAQERGWANSMMQEWVSSVLHVSKHIQTDVAPLLHVGEIENLALDYQASHRPDLENQTLLILGAGMIGQGLVRAAIPKVKKIIWCYHINRPDVPVCGEGQIELCTFNSVKDQLHAADLIVSATEAPGYVLHSGHAPFFDQEKPLCLIDLGMPRNIDPALNDLSIDLHLVDLDGLKHWHHRVVTDMDAVFARCRHFIEEHQEQYDRIIKSFQGGNAG